MVMAVVEGALLKHLGEGGMATVLRLPRQRFARRRLSVAHCQVANERPHQRRWQDDLPVVTDVLVVRGIHVGDRDGEQEPDRYAYDGAERPCKASCSFSSFFLIAASLHRRFVTSRKVQTINSRSAKKLVFM